MRDVKKAPTGQASTCIVGLITPDHRTLLPPACCFLLPQSRASSVPSCPECPPNRTLPYDKCKSHAEVSRQPHVQGDATVCTEAAAVCKVAATVCKGAATVCKEAATVCKKAATVCAGAATVCAEAATLFTPSCNPMCPRLQPYASKAVDLDVLERRARGLLECNATDTPGSRPCIDPLHHLNHSRAFTSRSECQTYRGPAVRNTARLYERFGADAAAVWDICARGMPDPSDLGGGATPVRKQAREYVRKRVRGYVRKWVSEYVSE